MHCFEDVVRDRMHAVIHELKARFVRMGSQEQQAGDGVVPSWRIASEIVMALLLAYSAPSIILH
jgi:hypothetical protein